MSTRNKKKRIKTSSSPQKKTQRQHATSLKKKSRGNLASKSTKTLSRSEQEMSKKTIQIARLLKQETTRSNPKRFSLKTRVFKRGNDLEHKVYEILRLLKEQSNGI
ncbi:MAG: hypothetical protein K9M07_03810 [Simkaniaceae bacterium]|nr:hypothetical protein [Simkaniaceae bacterium]